MPIPPRLRLKLPIKQENAVYQLVHLGSLSPNTKNRENVDIELFFQLKSKDRLKPLEEPIRRVVNLHHIPNLKVGSLWNYDGKLFQRSQETIKNFRDFEISNEGKILLLSQALPSYYSTLYGLLDTIAWQDAKNTFYYKLIIDSETILIPCIELLRVFGYKGTHLIDFFFKSSPVETIANILTEPAFINNFEGKIHLIGNYFKENEIAILAELLFNKNLRNDIYFAHSKLKSFWSKCFNDNKPVSAKLIYNITNENIANVRANGISINVNSKKNDKDLSEKIFIVTSIFQVKDFYSFKKLEYDFEEAFLQTVTHDISDQRDVQQKTKVFVKYEDNKDIIVDSSQAGYQRYSNSNTKLSVDDFYDMPLIKRNPKLLKEESENKFNIKRFSYKPAFLSPRGSGNSFDIAKGEIEYISENISIQNYFEEVIGYFTSKGYGTSILQINNCSNVPKMESNKSIFEYENKYEQKQFYKIGIALITKRNYYFYYIQALHGGRAGFLYQSNASMLEHFNIFDILKVLAQNDWDWVELNEIDAQETLISYVGKVIIHPRNHVDAKNAVSNCIKDIEDFLNNK